MGIVGLLWRARLRGSLRRVLALVLLTALGGGIALAVAAGARRTNDVQDAVIDLSSSSEVGASSGPGDPEEAARIMDSLPAVGDFSQLVGFQTLLPGTTLPNIVSLALYSDPVDVDRPLVLDGRLPATAEEIFLNETSAAEAGATVGDELLVQLAAPDYSEVFPPETMVVVGVGLFADEVYEDETGVKPAVVYAKAFVDAHRDQIAWGAAGATVAPGATRAELVRQLLDAEFTIDNDAEAGRDQARGSIRPLVATLWALSGLAGLATIVVVGQAFRMLVRRRPGESQTLSAMGCGRSTLLAADLAVALAVAVAGVLGSVAVAIVASPLFPQGEGRRISELRGVDVDLVVLGLGGLALLVALSGVVAGTSAGRAQRADLRPGMAPGALGARPAMSTGVRFATGRRRLVGTVGGVAAGMIGVVAAVVFTGSMSSLVARPDLAGFSWEVMGRESYITIDTAAVADEVGDDPDIERVTGLSFNDVSVDGTPIPASVWEAVKGSPWPPVVTGRAPQGPDEIMLSPRSLAEIGSEVGDTITVAFSTSVDQEKPMEVEMAVVGTAVSPSIGIPGTDTPRLDEGVLVRHEDIVRIEEQIAAETGLPLCGDEGADFETCVDIEYGSAVLFDLADGVDPGSVEARFPDGLPDDLEVPTEWFTSAEPSEVTQAARAVDVLTYLVVILLIGVMATVAHNLLGFVRERSDDFAVLRAVGFTRRQVRSTVLWQSGVVVVLAVVVALPVGVALGRGLYQSFAGGIGVIVQPVVPVAALALVVVGAVVLVQAVALLPARRARRTVATTSLAAA